MPASEVSGHAVARRGALAGTTMGSVPARATDTAYERLRDEIITLKLPPGLLINEQTLAERLGVTRPTLVQALHRLAETGLVSVLPRRGILISPVDLLDVQQVFDARAALESKVAELAAVRATAEQVEELRELARDLDQPVSDDHRYQPFLERDQQLHLAVAALARNWFLEDALARVWMVNRRLWHLFFRERGTAANYFLRHEAILSALERRDPAAAGDAVIEHLAHAKELLHQGLWGS